MVVSSDLAASINYPDDGGSRNVWHVVTSQKITLFMVSAVIT